MRKRFEVQYEFGMKLIEEIQLPLRSRDELASVLRALQHIYSTPSLHESVFSILESSIGTSATGRRGLSYWEILVLGVVRLTLAANYDRLEHIANYDKLVREFLGVSTFSGAGKRYPLQTIKDNVGLLPAETLERINEVIVKAGHQFRKKDEGLNIKVDTYTVESTVHFPTDLNLLWDASRKCIDLMVSLFSESDSSGWRKYKDWKRRLKRSFRVASRYSAGGGKNREGRLLQYTKEYLHLATALSEKIKSTKEARMVTVSGKKAASKLEQLNYFENQLDKHIDLVTRRILYRETIPHDEKIFSLFEPYTKWITKGKAGHTIELGLPIVVCTDQYGFILHHRVLEKECDVEITVPVAEKLLDLGAIKSISYDKGFWSRENYVRLVSKITHLIMPKKGKLNTEEYAREHSKEFKALRNNHSAIESDINSLEHHGLNRCPDKGLHHFKQYAALGVLSFNLHRLGNILIENDRKKVKQNLKAA